jgi:hypothetical protein
MSAGSFLPTCSGRCAGDLLSLFWRKAFCSSLSALHSADAPLGRMPLRFADGILRFANRNVEHLSGKLCGITRTFGHETSMPQAAPPIHAMKFQTEALPNPFTTCSRIGDSDYGCEAGFYGLGSNQMADNYASIIEHGTGERLWQGQLQDSEVDEFLFASDITRLITTRTAEPLPSTAPH